MNAATVTLIDRPFPEVVDDLLTALTGGVVKEAIIFDVKEDLYALSRPASQIRSITGTLKQVHTTFQNNVDFLFSAGDNAVVWQKGGNQPDDETTFFVNYFVPNSTSPLTDINVGSVTRTLGEAIGREIATVFGEINDAYSAGFIDTATGKSLDLVVSILNVVRKSKEFATGLVTFFRDPAIADGNITIPEGISLSTAKGEATFVTTEQRTLQRGQARIDVPVSATAGSKGAAGVVAAGAINTLQQAITGIAKITNFDATVFGSNGESDDDLRIRARSVLQGIDKATLAALFRAVSDERATVTEFWDPNGPAAKQANPGTVALLVQTSPERFTNLQSAVNEVRAAGVQSTLIAKYVFYKPRMVVTIASGLTAAGKIKLVGQIIDAMQQYTDTLSAGQAASGTDLIKAIVKAVAEIGDAKNIRMVDVMAWTSDIGKPAAETFLDQLVQAAESVPAGNHNALVEALSEVVTNAAPQTPSENLIPARDLVQGPSGQRATDQEIEAGTFTVQAKVHGEDWTVALKSDPADIFLTEH